MGMFDSIKLQGINLPDSYEPKDGLFQTKDLNCKLDVYIINDHGYIYNEKTGEIPELSVTFYDYETISEEPDQKVTQVHQYTAYFTLGKLREIVQDIP